MSIIGMAEDIKLVDSFLLAIGKTDRGGDVEKNVVLNFIRHIRAAQKKGQGESPVNNTQQTIPGSQKLTQISALVDSTIESLRRGCGPNMWDFLEDLQKLLVS